MRLVWAFGGPSTKAGRRLRLTDLLESEFPPFSGLSIRLSPTEAGSGQEGPRLRRRPGPSPTCRRCWATLPLCGAPFKLAKGE